MGATVALLSIVLLTAGGNFYVPQGSEGGTLPYRRSTEQFLARIGLPALRSNPHQLGRFELRVWEGFGIGPLRLYVVRGTGERWGGESYEQTRQGKPRIMPVPRAVDWARLREAFDASGVMAAAPQRDDGSCASVLDGISYFVEMTDDTGYHAAAFDNPAIRRSEIGDRLLRLLPTLAAAFGREASVDVAHLPRGERQIVASFSGDIPVELAERAADKPSDLHGTKEGERSWLFPTEALRQALALPRVSCRQLPVQVSANHIQGDVPVEITIRADGTVAAARPLGGPPLLQPPSVELSLSLEFLSAAEERLTRRTVVTVRYRDEWVEFPWLK